jgi:hypothetical protein
MSHIYLKCMHSCFFICWFHVAETKKVFPCFQDGTERSIESISLIDAVLPEVLEQRKQGAMKGAQMKNEAPGANGEEGT